MTVHPPIDAAAVAAAAQQRDPGLPPETAALLTGQVEALLPSTGTDAPALARALLAANPDVGATPANVVATSTVEWLASHG